MLSSPGSAGIRSDGLVVELQNQVDDLLTEVGRLNGVIEARRAAAAAGVVRLKQAVGLISALLDGLPRVEIECDEAPQYSGTHKLLRAYDERRLMALLGLDLIDGGDTTFTVNGKGGG